MLKLLSELTSKQRDPLCHYYWVILRLLYKGGRRPGEWGLGELFNSFHFNNFGIEFLDHLHKLLVFLAIFKKTLLRFISKIGYSFLTTFIFSL